MVDRVLVVNETIQLKESVSAIVEPVRCRKCNEELTPRAHFKYCDDCADYYYMRKWHVQQ
jgi:Zn finger protein HypA/HybF involved in hydrogenase expression